MPPGSQSYVVRNFSDELDWRTVHFVDPPPPSRVCSACGVVVRRTGLLPCGHYLCSPCHLQLCELGGPLCCPLDGLPCPEKRIQWRAFPSRDMDRAVYCWNKDKGCSDVLAVRELPEHFFLECRHHMVTCPKCLTKVLYNSLCLHLRSCTGRHGPGVAESAEETGNNQQTAELTALKTTLSTATLQMERQLGDLKGLLEQLKLEGNLQAEQVNSLSHTMNSLKEVQMNQGNALSCTMNDLKETLQRDLDVGAIRNRNGITQRQAVDVGTVGETGRQTFQKIDLALRCILRTQSSHEWTLKGYGSLKARAMREGSADRLSGPVYLCHYFLRQGVSFERENQEVRIHMNLCLMRGEVDEYLQWPFSRKMALSVVHPDTGEKRTAEFSPNGRRDFFSRPATDCNPLFFFRTCLYLNDLEHDGYVTSNQLELCFTLLA